MFCAFMFKIYMETQEHARFHVFSPFSASLTPHYIIMVSGLLVKHLGKGPFCLIFEHYCFSINL